MYFFLDLPEKIIFLYNKQKKNTNSHVVGRVDSIMYVFMLDETRNVISVMHEIFSMCKITGMTAPSIESLNYNSNGNNM